MIRSRDTRAQWPIVVANVRSTRTWRPRDMMNWHRMVAPLRALESPSGISMDLFDLILQMCTHFEVRYEPQSEPVVRPSASPLRAYGPSVAIFVDSPDHTSGVATTIRQWAELARAQGCDLRIYYSGETDLFPSGYRFSPVGRMHLGCYPGLVLRMPSVTEVIRHVEENPPDVFHLSTPGPMGLIGLGAARQLGAPVCGTYHTDFPAYAAQLTGGFAIEQTAWRFMRWFYGHCQQLATPSLQTLRNLAAHGFRERDMSVVGRGIRTDLFSPEFRDPEQRTKWNPAVRHWLLYVGRLSKEKNLDCLADAFRAIHAQQPDTGLVLAGEGPYRAELESRLAGLPVVFTGIQKGEDLARVYASADLFLFPSLTDTLGVVLLEAQASGLPVLVSDSGGPKDTILPRVTGEIIEPMNPTLLARAAVTLLRDPGRRETMSAAARRHALSHTPARSFEAFWSLHQPCFTSRAEGVS